MGKRRLTDNAKKLIASVLAILGSLGIGKKLADGLAPAKNHTPIVDVLKNENPNIQVKDDKITFDNFLASSEFSEKYSKEIEILDKVANGDISIDNLNDIDNDVLASLLLQPAKENILDDMKEFIQYKQDEGQDIDINLEEMKAECIYLYSTPNNNGGDRLQITYNKDGKNMPYPNVIDCSKMYSKDSKKYEELLGLTQSVGNIVTYDPGTKNDALKSSMKYMLTNYNEMHDKNLAYVDTSENKFKESIKYVVDKDGNVSKVSNNTELSINIDYKNYQEEENEI